jgi:nuclease A inhibitor-like protein
MSMTKERFDELTEGVLYMSETDAPLTYYELDTERSRQWPPSTGGQFLQLIGEDSGTPVETLTPEKFLWNFRQDNEFGYERARALLAMMIRELQNVVGFRVGEIEIHIFVLGQDDSGKVVGFRTLSVET